MDIPNRIDPLIKILEEGGTITQDDLNRAAQLQALDIAKVGWDYVNERIKIEEETTKILESI
jgi:hypothetical protein